MSEGEEELRNVLGTTSFGAKASMNNLGAAYTRTKRQLPSIVRHEPSGTSSGSSSPSRKQEVSGEDSMEDSSDEDELELPITHEIVLSKHSRAVSGLALDTAGSRLVSGGQDGNIALWDFAGMSASCRPFKIISPEESHRICAVEFNCSSELILACSASNQPRILTREGEDMAEMAKGDPYLRDLKGTRGHVAEVTAGAWNPKHKSHCMTASADATIRLWDALNVNKCLQVLVHKPKAAGAGRVKCTAASYSHDGKTIGGAYLDGTLSLWATDGPYHRPMGGVISDAHVKGTETSSLAFSMNGWLLASRGSDCVKLWDRRHFKAPLMQLDSLPNRFSNSDIIFSPNNQELLVPSSDATTAAVKVLSPKTLKLETTIPFTSPVVKLLYHSKLNQIVTGHADGDIRVLYTPEKSTRGAKLVVSKAPKARHVDDLITADIDESAGEIVANDSTSLPFSNNRARNAARKDPRKSNMPEMPGTQRYAERKDIGEVVNFRDQDPQKELLKYDEVSKKDPIFFGVYSKNQPVTLYAAAEENEEDGDGKPVSKKPKFTPRT